MTQMQDPDDTTQQSRFLYYSLSDYLILLLALGLVGICVRFYYSHPDDPVTGILLALFSFLLMILIAVSQHFQLKRIKAINVVEQEQLQYIADINEKLALDRDVESRVQKFFHLRPLGKRSEPVYICYYPVEGHQKPLPVVNQGDFAALRVFRDRIGEGRITMEMVPRGLELDDFQTNKSAIFLCSPVANRTVVQAIGYDTADIVTTKGKLGKTLPPVWFALDNGELVIVKLNRHNPLRSKALQDCYHKVNENDWLCGKPSSQRPDSCDSCRDIAIIARLHMDKAPHHIILAGVHQHGTWIAAEFVDRLLSRNNFLLPHQRDIFFDERDCVAVVTGEFKSDNWTVRDPGIVHGCLWQRIDDDKWEPVSHDPEE